MQSLRTNPEILIGKFDRPVSFLLRTFSTDMKLSLSPGRILKLLSLRQMTFLDTRSIQDKSCQFNWIDVSPTFGSQPLVFGLQPYFSVLLVHRFFRTPNFAL